MSSVPDGPADGVAAGVLVGGASGVVDAEGWVAQPAMKIAAARATNLNDERAALNDERAAAPDRDCTREGYGNLRFLVALAR